ncbi:MAG TPA: bifunctional DNA-formamidopyrimidine glycosylase/DNA-(apurinic or apyrimidinic site) lyase [Patescibacteria group bacterium]
MPELPEVETVRRGLEKYFVGHIIEDIDIKKPKIFQGDKKNITGAKVVAVKRFGKGLVIDLSNKYSMAIHIKLTGQLIYRGKDEPHVIHTDLKRVGNTLPNPWTHVIFHLDRGATLYYNDIRQFGWIKVVPTEKVSGLPFFKDLGPEFPLVSDSGQARMTEKMFGEVLSKSKIAIKPLIMDQKKMSGLGNIYANDGLYLAKIDPKRPAYSLTSKEIKSLYSAILEVLNKGLKEGGASELTFVNVLGESGNYQNHSLVYGKNGQKCKRDGTIIKRIMLGGRGTFFCPTCQK